MTANGRQIPRFFARWQLLRKGGSKLDAPSLSSVFATKTGLSLLKGS
jgi:hypothetical protein